MCPLLLPSRSCYLEEDTGRVCLRLPRWPPPGWEEAGAGKGGIPARRCDSSTGQDDLDSTFKTAGRIWAP